MRRYTITVNDTQKVIDVESQGANVFRVRLDGRTIDVTLDDHRDLAHAPVTPAVVARRPPTGGPVAGPVAATPAVPVAVAPADPGTGAEASAPAAARPDAPPASGGRPPAGSAGRDRVTAPMPGVILSVDTTVGTSVRRGQTLMVLEAMKMKNELKAPRDGVVAELYVAVGQQVKYGETLVRFEE